MSETDTVPGDEQYAAYYKALAEPDWHKRQGMFTDGEILSCYGRVWVGDALEPIAMWDDADGFNCTMGRGDNARSLSLKEAQRYFIETWKNLVPKAAYDKVAWEGAPWPDLDAEFEKRRQGIGGNQPPDQHKLLEEQIDSARARLADFSAIPEGRDAIEDIQKQALVWRNRLNELARECDVEKGIEIGDHYRIYERAQKRWDKLSKKAREAGAVFLKFADLCHKTVERKAEEEREAYEAAQRAEAERLQAEADRQIAAGVPPSEQTAPDLGLQVETPPLPPPTKIRPAYGRAASVVTVKVIKIVDWAAVAQFFKDDAEIEKAFQTRIRREINAGKTVPGVEVTEETKLK